LTAGLCVDIQTAIVQKGIVSLIALGSQIRPRGGDRHQSIPFIAINHIAAKNGRRVALDDDPVFVLGDAVTGDARRSVLSDIDTKSRSLKNIVLKLGAGGAIDGDAVCAVVIKIVVLKNRRTIANDRSAIVAIARKGTVADDRTGGFCP